MKKLMADVKLTWGVAQMAPFDGYFANALVLVDVQQMVDKSWLYSSLIMDHFENEDEEALNAPACIDAIEDFLNRGGLKNNSHPGTEILGTPTSVYVNTVELVEEEEEE